MEFLALRVREDPSENLDYPAYLGKREYPDILESGDHLVSLAHRACLERQELQDLRVQRVSLDLWESQVCRGPLACQESLDVQVSLARRDHPDPLDLKVDLECLDHLDCLDSLEREDFLVYL